MGNNYPPQSSDTQSDIKVAKRHRDSNLELYRIVVMLLIVAHHFVVNSGLNHDIIDNHDSSLGAYIMLLFGGWGKIGINCFVLITGYYMCKSSITLKKFVKLYLQIIMYCLILDLVFMYTGHLEISVESVIKYFWHFVVVTGVDQNFIGCFLAFWLCIPFLNILVNHLTKREHGILAILLAVFFILLAFNPLYRVSLDYIEWFSVLYIIASYIRFYEFDFSVISHKAWGWLSLISLLLASSSIVMLTWLWASGRVSTFAPYFLVADSNMILAVAVAITTFMWFKSIKLRHSKIINAFGGATFGVLLIHANSDAMRQWLWRETVDVVGHFHSLSTFSMILYSISAVLGIFVVCAVIDIARQRWIEPHINPRIENFLSKIWEVVSNRRILKKPKLHNQ